jgi:hypothetical protein
MAGSVAAGAAGVAAGSRARSPFGWMSVFDHMSDCNLTDGPIVAVTLGAVLFGNGIGEGSTCSCAKQRANDGFRLRAVLSLRVLRWGGHVCRQVVDDGLKWKARKGPRAPIGPRRLTVV